ncbi:zinc ribbon domain-containing protein [Euryarchaeota archaeon]|nr:zinc ribbon domain-containing protein [Euryarchaeota archaeon]MDP7374426.1 zinc ribbon domain-containing protein [Candidatus Poseidoniaceae archaeon]
MSESPTVDEFIRHMQAELDACDDIVDKNERQKRQWQIESSLLLAIEFSTRFKELSKLGQNPLKIVQALSTPNADNAEIAKQVIAIAGGMCPHCGASVDPDLDFCSACGNYIE